MYRITWNVNAENEIKLNLAYAYFRIINVYLIWSLHKGISTEFQLPQAQLIQ